jgi:DNA-nicking Smr family endonuclease
MAGKDRSRPLTEDDLLVWRLVARSARPLPGRELPPESPPPSVKQAAPSAAKPSVAASAPATPGVKRPAAPAEIGGEKRMRRGKVEVDASIDLHGMTLMQARDALGRFVARERANGLRIVLVVTGKGRGGDGAIRRETPDWLRQEAAHVSGYAEAHQRHGGAGALYVRLRRVD